MIALDSGGTIKWSSPVPASDPLRAKEGDPESHAVEGGRIVVVHAFARPDETRVTCFEQRSGRRLWETKLGEISWYRLEPTERYVLLGSSPNVHVLSLADGKLLRVIGLQR